ncbi:quinone oxidoreductase family protein [Agromyces soli]|uniref:Zinc-binding dehydrogenase n=1 Tax=Agromyces soli TaxID=659012 RepID=A0ABY4AY36_9MICO|nr:zinc-binding dehydrogenase [Agromyces soli]UOE26748.1 zinc-binding dehydrogenase [Agromyces soli]
MTGADAGMQALVHGGAPGLDGLRVAWMPAPTPAAGQVLLAVEYAGLNRHELFTAERRDGSEPARILGADAVGRVVGLGPAARPGRGGDGPALGDRVLLDPTLNWPERARVPEHPDLLGGRAPGTFAEFVAVPAGNAHAVPAHLSGPEAGALGLAAVTAYRALFTVGELTAGEHLLIPGIGSGVGLLALDLALAAGARVTVTSRSAEKRAFALDRGAAAAVPSDELGGVRLPLVDLVVDTVGAASVPAALGTLRPGGRVVTLGATTGAEIRISLRELFFRQLSLRGTSVGSAEEFRDALAFVREHGIRPVVDAVHPLDEAPAAMRASADGRTLGKTVFRMPGTLDEGGERP